MTIKQKKALENAVGNGGNITRAMLDAGYSPNTANTPQKLTESKAWEDVMEQYFPDKIIGKKIEEGLEANRVLSAKILVQGGEQTDDFIEVPDHAVRHKFVETALKLKKRLSDAVITPLGGVSLTLNILNYGNNDPLQLSATQAHGAGVERLTPISSLELAQEGTEDNTSDK